MGQQHHQCPRPKRGWMPLKIHEAAIKGETEVILPWLENGGDVNVADMNDQTLLFIACAFGHSMLVKELLNHKNVHLNQLTTKSATPLIAASSNGHFGCVEALLSSSNECQVNYAICSEDKFRAIILAARAYHWDIVDMILRTDKKLEPSDVCYILHMSVKFNEWSLARNIIEREIPFDVMDLPRVLDKIYASDRWEYTSAVKLFRKAVFCQHDRSNAILRRMLDKKDWKELEKLLRVLCGSVKLDACLSEAILGDVAEETKKLLEKIQVKEENINGALLVAAIGGASESTGTLLLSQDYRYSSIIMDQVLILSCLNNSSELLPLLLQRGSYSCTVLSRAFYAAPPKKISRLILKRALKQEAERIIPLSTECEYGDGDDDDDDDCISWGGYLWNNKYEYDYDITDYDDDDDVVDDDLPCEAYVRNDALFELTVLMTISIFNGTL